MLIDLVNAGKVAEFVDLAPFTTYKVGGPARWFLDAEGLTDLESLGPYAGRVLVVGRGSNLVVADEGYPGLVVRLGSGFSQITIGEDGLVVAGANAPLPAVARAAAKASIAGFSWMVGVPGSVGGAVRMNAGCFGSETSIMLTEVSIWDVRAGERIDKAPTALGYGYRTSNLTPYEVVVEASFLGSKGEAKNLEAEMREITRWRRDHQPGGTHNAGSVFKNPVDDAAGRIIDDLGLKGTRVGKVSVSMKHANFFVAEPGATARDIRNLVDVVARIVLDRTGVSLVPEMVFVGFD